MTKFEAIQAMKEGKKVTHRYFDKNEWVTMEGNTILFEDGVRCSQPEFWIWRNKPEWEIDWSLWE